MKEDAISEIQERIEAFYHGEPQHIEVEVADGVYFVSDSEDEQDLMEPTMMASVLIEPDSPHNEGVPSGNPLLFRYSEFGDELVADVVYSAVHGAGGEFTELGFTYSSNNSNEETGFLVFLGCLPNQRVAYNWRTGEVEVNEVYA